MSTRVHDQITIVVPTRNRPHYLARLMGFYNRTPPYFRMLVLDSSDVPVALDLDLFRNVDISIHRYPPDTLLADKMVDGYQRVQTRYVQVCADDDFIVQEGIVRSAEFLEGHPEYSAAQGTCFHFTTHRDEDSGQISLGEGLWEHQNDVDFDRAEQRLLWHMENYRPTYYAVHRVADFKDWYQRAWAAAPHILHLELMPSAATVIHGKVKRLDVPFEFREQHDGRMSSFIQTWNDLISSGDWDKYSGWVIAGLQRELSFAGGVDDIHEVAIAAIQEWVRLWHRRYYRRTAKGTAVFAAMREQLRLREDTSEAAASEPESLVSRLRRPFLVRRGLKTVAHFGMQSMQAVATRIPDVPQDEQQEAVLSEAEIARQRVVDAISSNFESVYR